MNEIAKYLDMIEKSVKVSEMKKHKDILPYDIVKVYPGVVKKKTVFNQMLNAEIVRQKYNK